MLENHGWRQHGNLFSANYLIIYASFITLLAALFPQCSEAAVSANLGINYGQIANNLPPPKQVVQLIRSTSIRKMKLYDANPMILGAFANSGVEFIVGVKNEEISSLLDSQVALKWASENVALYMQPSPIRYIAVGNQILTAQNVSSSLHTQLVTVMQNLYSALVALRLSNRVFISTPHSMAILNNTFPPSSGSFTEDLTRPVMLPLLRFLNQTGAPLMMNIYPYFSYKAKPLDVSLAYALFLNNNGVTDKGTGLHYDNLFDAQVDAVYSAMAKLGFTNIPVLVSETGWPSNGSPIELGASISNAMTYNRNLVKHVGTGSGTPMRPKESLTVYLFALFNENRKPGPTSQKYFGVFRPGDLSPIYDIGILQGHASSNSTTTPPPPPLTIPVPRPPSPFTIPIPRPPHSPVTPPSPVPALRPPVSPSKPPSPPPLPICRPEPSPSPPYIPKPPPSRSPPSTPVYRYPPPPELLRPPAVPSPVSRSPPVIPSPVIYPPPVYTYPPVIPAPALPPPPPVTQPSPGQGNGGTRIWCVSKPGGDRVTLMGALNYACGEGGADCSAVQPGGPCFEPNNLDSHASYAFNSYYQKHGRNYWNCDFNGNGLVTVTDPSYGSCIYPAQ